MPTPESQVRLFQAPQVTPGTKDFPYVAQPRVVRLQIGRHGATIKTFSWHISSVITFYCTRRPKELTDFVFGGGGLG